MLKLKRNDYVLQKGLFMKKRLSIILAGLVLLFTLVGCGSTKESSKEFTVMTSFYPMYAFTKAIVGDSGKVEMMTPPGMEPHDYEPSAKEMAKMVNADAFVYNNDHLETWFPKAKANLTQTKIINASAGIHLLKQTDDKNTEIDPHIWLSPKEAIHEVENIRDGLCKANPKEADTFKKNATAYLKKLHQLDRDYQRTLAHTKDKTIVTQHMAFSYLAHDYGLKQLSIMGLSEDQEPTASHLADLKKAMKEQNIHYICVESNANNKVAKTLAEETNSTLLSLNPLESLTDKQQQKGDNYISVMQQNLQTLKTALNS